MNWNIKSMNKNIKNLSTYKSILDCTNELIEKFGIPLNEAIDTLLSIKCELLNNNDELNDEVKNYILY